MVGKTLAVMGFGKVGSEVARRAKGLGMNVIAHDPYAPADRARAVGVELVSFDQAISTADFISLHMPLTPTTNKVFNDNTFAKMKKGVRIVNVARGGVIDEDALVKALDSGIVAQVKSFGLSSLLFLFFIHFNNFMRKNTLFTYEYFLHQKVLTRFHSFFLPKKSIVAQVDPFYRSGSPTVAEWSCASMDCWI